MGVKGLHVIIRVTKPVAKSLKKHVIKQTYIFKHKPCKKVTNLSRSAI